MIYAVCSLGARFKSDGVNVCAASIFAQDYLQAECKIRCLGVGMSLTAKRFVCVSAIIAALVFQFHFPDPATAADMTWQFSEGNDAANRGRMTACLGYGVPETDNAQADGVCDVRGGPANLILGADVGDLKDGSDVKVRFSGGGVEHTLAGRVFGTTIEEGITGVSLDIDVEDAVWSALTSKDSLDYQVPGYSSSRLKLQDGHAKIRQFIRACRDYAQSAGTNTATATKPKDEKTVEQPEAAKAPDDTGVNEKEAFASAKELGSLEGWEAFLEKYPNGFRADLARAYVKRLGGDSAKKADAQKSATPETKKT